MVISTDSQLGLKFVYDNNVKIDCLRLLESQLHGFLKRQHEVIEKCKKRKEFLESISSDMDNGYKEYTEEYVRAEFEKEEYLIPDNSQDDGINTVREFCDINHMFMYENYPIKYFLVQQSVYKAAELIKIGENFTGRTLKDIKHGDYIYLMGKTRMIKFIVVECGIKGIYYDSKDNVVFEWGIEMESGKPFYTVGFQKEFSQIMQVLIFIELGDIEVKYLESLRTNGVKNKQDKIYNASHYNVYVVDSTWNQILIRTEGFAVRGHFKLQPCGPGGADRKLIWVNAYEKDGYTRKPKATIIHNS